MAPPRLLCLVPHVLWPLGVLELVVGPSHRSSGSRAGRPHPLEALYSRALICGRSQPRAHTHSCSHSHTYGGPGREAGFLTWTGTPATHGPREGKPEPPREGGGQRVAGAAPGRVGRKSEGSAPRGRPGPPSPSPHTLSKGGPLREAGARGPQTFRPPPRQQGPPSQVHLSLLPPPFHPTR